MAQAGRTVFVNADLQTSHGRQLVDDVPLQYRSSTPTEHWFEGLATRSSVTIRASEAQGSFRPRPATVLLDGGLVEPPRGSCVTRPQSVLVRSLALAVWAEQMGLPPRALQPRTVDEYRAALCDRLLREADTGLKQWLPRTEVEQLLRRADATCATPSEQKVVQAKLAGLYPRGVLESELADWAREVNPRRFQNVVWYLRNPLHDVAMQGESRIPELLELARSPVISRNGRTVGEVAVGLLSYHAMRMLPDASAAAAWWSEAKSQTHDDRLASALWHPDASTWMVAERFADRYGWDAVDMKWPPACGSALASRLLSSDTAGSRQQKRRLVRRLVREPGLLHVVFELDRTLALDLLVRRHEPANAIHYADQIIEAEHTAGLRQLASQLEDPTTSIEPWLGSSLCDGPDCPEQLRDALRRRLVLELASMHPEGRERRRVVARLGKILGVPADVFERGHPVVDQRSQVDAALLKSGFDPLQSPLRRTAVEQRNALAGFRTTGPPSPALKSAASWLEARLGKPIENPYLFMWEFWAAMAAEHESAWQLRVARPREGGIIVDVSDDPTAREGIGFRDGETFSLLEEPWAHPPSIHQLTESFGLDWSAPQAEPWIELTFVFSLPLRARITRTPPDG